MSEKKKYTFHDYKTQILILVGFILVGTGFWYYMSNQPIVPDNAHESFNMYSKYLKKTTGDDSKIEANIAEAEANEGGYTHQLILYNKTETFYCGVLEVLDVDGKVIYSKEYVNVRPAEVRVVAVVIEGNVSDFRIKDHKYYEFTYPKPAASARVSNDGVASINYQWTNIIFYEEDLTVDNCMEYAKYIYIQDILSGMPSYDIYFYGENSVEYVDGYVQKPSFGSGTYGGTLDQEKGSVSIMDLKTDMFKVLLEEVMK